MRATQSAFTVIRTPQIGHGGCVSWTLYPKHSLTYRIDFAGDADWEPASAEVTVSVRPRIRLSAPAAIYKGQKAAFVVQVSPAHPGATVQLQRKDGDTWTDWRQVTLNAKSRAKRLWRGTAVGKTVVRAVMAADESHVAGRSKRVTVLVRKPTPYNVPASAAHFIVVDKSQYRLYYFERGLIVRVFDCVLGKPSTPTPLGRFRIYAKDPDMGGPYGPRRMRYHGLYAIHGTNEPALLRRFPRAYSHGCTRLSNTNILWLYARCPVGTQVWNVP